MSNYSLGEARGRIVIETEFSDVESAQNAIRGLDDAGQRAASGGLGSAQKALDKTGTAALVAGGTVVAAFAAAVNTAADFEFQLSAIQAVSGSTAEEMDLISEAALRIGKDTAFSATDAALAMEELVKAGVSVQDVLGGAADATVALAAAGGVDLPMAATIAANAMNQFNLSASDLVGVTDTIAGAANASAIDVAQFGNSMSQVGAVANLAGLSFDDTALAIAAMGNAGVVGSDAGTSLKGVLMNLIPSTNEAAEEMKRLGLITEDGTNQFYTAEGSLKSLSEVSDILGGALAGMTDAQKQATLATLFGSDAIRGAAVIAKEGSAGFSELSDAINKTSAAEVAATRMDNLKGQLEQLKGTMETIAIQIGQVLIPRMAEMATAIGNALDWFLGLDQGVKDAIVGFGTFVGSALLVIGILIKTVGAVQSVVATVTTLKTAFVGIGAVALEIRIIKDAFAAASATGGIFAGVMAATVAPLNSFRAGLVSSTAAASTFTGVMGTLGGAAAIAAGAIQRFTLALVKNPLTLVVVALAAIAAAMIHLYQTSEEFRALFVPVLDAIAAAGEQLAPVFEELGAALSDALGQAIEALVPVISMLVQAFAPLVTTLVGSLAPIIGILAQILGAILGPVLEVVAVLITVLANVLVVLLQALMPVIDLLVAILVPVLEGLGWVLEQAAAGIAWFGEQMSKWFAAEGPKAVSGMGTAFTDLYNGVIAPFVQWCVEAWQNIQTAVAAVVDWFNSYVAPVIGAVATAVVGFFTGIWNALVAAFDFVVSVVTSAVNGVVAIFNFLQSVATAVWNGIMAVITPVVAWFATYVVPLIVAYVNLIAAIFNYLVSVVVFVWNQIMTAIQAVVSWIMTYVAPVIVAAVNLVAAIFNYLVSVVVFVWNSIMAAIQAVITWIMTYIAPVIQAAVGLWVALFNMWLTNVINIWNTIVDIISTAINFVLSVVTTVVSAIVDFVVTAWNNMMNVINAVMGFIGSVISTVWNAIYSTVSSILSAVFSVVSSVWGSVYSFISQIVNNVWNTISAVWSGLVGVVSGIFNGVYNAVKGPIDDILNVIGGIYDQVVGFFSDAGSWLMDAGANIIGGLIEGVQNALGGLTSVLNGITSMIPAEKGPPEKDAVLLTPAGESIIDGLINGMQNKFSDLRGMLGDVTMTIPQELNTSVLANAGAALPAAATEAQTIVNNENTFNVTTDEDPEIWARGVAREFDDRLESVPV